MRGSRSIQIKFLMYYFSNTCFPNQISRPRILINADRTRSGKDEKDWHRMHIINLSKCHYINFRSASDLMRIMYLHIVLFTFIRHCGEMPALSSSWIRSSMTIAPVFAVQLWIAIRCTVLNPESQIHFTFGPIGFMEHDPIQLMEINALVIWQFPLILLHNFTN